MRLIVARTIWWRDTACENGWTIICHVLIKFRNWILYLCKLSLMLSCMFLILQFKHLPWNIQTLEQGVNWEILKNLNNICFELSSAINWHVLTKFRNWIFFLNTLSCMLLILLFKPLLWHIQTIEQWLNWEILKDLNVFHYLQKSVLQS